MSKKQQELLDKAYNKYQSQTWFHIDDLASLKESDGMNMSTGERKKVYRQYAQEEFINKCKTDTEFSEKWGLTIEERELSEKERIILAGYDYENKGGIGWNMVKESVDLDNSIPRKLITITHNDKTIESYA